MLMVRRLKQAMLTLAVHGLRGAEGSPGESGHDGGKQSRDRASCRRSHQPSQTLAGLIPLSLPNEVQ